MEWYDLFRLPLVLFWIVPASLLLGFAIFMLLAPIAVLAGAGLRLTHAVGVVLRRKKNTAYLRGT